jgi:hypothetical protein
MPSYRFRKIRFACIVLPACGAFLAVGARLHAQSLAGDAVVHPDRRAVPGAGLAIVQGQAIGSDDRELLSTESAVRGFFGVPSCPEEPRVDNHIGPPAVPLLAFLAGEQVGAVFDVPADDYPIEILRLGVGWGSQFGGNPSSLEQALHIYPAGLPNPGTAQFSLPGPVLIDGIINEFDISALAGNKIINSGPFTVALELANQSSPPFGSAPMHDNMGCIAGRNAVFVIPDGWSDACPLGVTGNWVFHVVYRQLDCSPDCNSNGYFDGDDISAGTSLDCNSNGSPDDCEMIDDGDFDNDGSVDLQDAAGLLDCLNGPGTAPDPTISECADLCLDAFDDDADSDVDLNDAAGFQILFDG